MNIYATSGQIAYDFGFAHSQVIQAIETLSFPEIISQHIEIFDFGDNKIAQMSAVGFNAVVLNLPINCGGNDELILRWRAAFLGNQAPDMATLTNKLPPITSDPAVKPPLMDESIQWPATAQINQGPWAGIVPPCDEPGDQGADRDDGRALGLHNYIPINDPQSFVQHLQAIMLAIDNVMELTKEKALAPVINGVRVYFEEDGKLGFQAAGQFHRPTEFLQALLDMIHVHFEPYPLTTFGLNSNLGFLYEAISDQPFSFGYLSLISERTKEFSHIWREQVIPHAQRCGYALAAATAVLVVVSTDQQQYDVAWAAGILQSLNAGYGVQEAHELLLANVTDEIPTQTHNTFVGFCVDEALVNKIRISVWLTNNNPVPASIH